MGGDGAKEEPREPEMDGKRVQPSKGLLRRSTAIWSALLYCSLVAQEVKNLLATWETQVRSLGWEDPLEKGNGYPSQYSCLGNPMDRAAWRAIVQGVAKELDTAE